MPHPASELGTCVQGVRQAILDWSDDHPVLGRIADPVTAQILALLQTLIDLIARFAAGEFSPRAPAHAPIVPARTATPAQAPRGARAFSRAARPRYVHREAALAPALRARAPGFRRQYSGPRAHRASLPSPVRPRPHPRARPPPNAKTGVPATAPTHAHIVPLS
jgi:hypothetical protein